MGEAQAQGLRRIGLCLLRQVDGEADIVRGRALLLCLSEPAQHRNLLPLIPVRKSLLPGVEREESVRQLWPSGWVLLAHEPKLKQFLEHSVDVSSTNASQTGERRRGNAMIQPFPGTPQRLREDDGLSRRQPSSPQDR